MKSSGPSASAIQELLDQRKTAPTRDRRDAVDSKAIFPLPRLEIQDAVRP